MKRTNEAFKAEVFQRSQAYKIKRAAQRRRLLTLCCCLAAASGLFFLRPSSVEKLAKDANTESAIAPEAPQAAPMEAPAAVMEEQAWGLVRLADGSAQALEPEDGAFLDALLDNAAWQNTAPDCLPDFRLESEAGAFLYHSSCGTIQQGDACLALEESQRTELNNLIQRYFPNN